MPEPERLVTITEAEYNRLCALQDKVIGALSQQGDDLCWMDLYRELGQLVGRPFEPRLLSREDMLQNCARFIDSLLTGWPYGRTTLMPARPAPGRPRIRVPENPGWPFLYQIQCWIERMFPLVADDDDQVVASEARQFHLELVRSLQEVAAPPPPDLTAAAD